MRRTSIDHGRLLANALCLVLLASVRADANPLSEQINGDVKESRPRIALVPPSDLMIKTRLREIYSELEGLKAVDIIVKGGVVHLRGTADGAQSRKLARDLAERLEGVVYVDDAISTSVNYRQRLAPVGRKIRSYAQGTLRLVPALVVAAVMFSFFFWLGKVARRWTWPTKKLGLKRLTANFTQLMVQVVLVVVGLLIALDVLDVMAAAGLVVGTLGVIGIAMAFAFRDLAKNYIPGILLSLERPFDVGDLIRICDEEGRVMRVTERETVLMTLSGNVLRIPNQMVFDETVVNYSTHPRRRFDFMVPVTPRTDLRKLRKVGVEALRKVSGVLDDPGPFMRTAGIEESRVEVRFYGWVNQEENEFLNVEQRAKGATYEALLGAGVTLPIPVIGLADLDDKNEAGLPLDDNEYDEADHQAERMLLREVEEGGRAEDNLLR